MILPRRRAAHISRFWGVRSEPSPGRLEPLLPSLAPPPPQVPLYDITYPEVIELLSPREAVLSDQAILSPSLLTLRPTPGTAHLSFYFFEESFATMRLFEPSLGNLPLQESEVVASVTLQQRITDVVSRVNQSDLEVTVAAGRPIEFFVEIRNDTWKLSDANGALAMDLSTKHALIDGFLSEKDECTGWNALVADNKDAMIAGLTVLSQYRVSLRLPPLVGYQIRVPETISLIVPGAALTSNEDIATEQDGYPPNRFVLAPNTASGESHEAINLAAGETRNGELRYFSEQWYTFDVGSAAAAAVVRVDVDFNQQQSRYGALQLQVRSAPSRPSHQLVDPSFSLCSA